MIKPNLASRHKAEPAIAMAPLMLWGVVSLATALALAGGWLMWLGMEKTHRPTFWKHRQYRQYLDEWAWEGRVVAAVGSGNDASRAAVLKNFSLYYWPPQAKVRGRLWWPKLGRFWVGALTRANLPLV